MAGVVVRHCVKNGIRKSELTTDTIKSIIAVDHIKEVFVDRQNLLVEETKQIEEFSEEHPDVLLMNSQKNPQIPSKNKTPRSQSDVFSRRPSDDEKIGV